MTPDDLKMLYNYNYWAHHRLLDVVKTSSPDQFTKDLGSSHGGIQGTLVHTMGAEEIWLARWKGSSPANFYSADQFPTFDSLYQHWGKVESEMLSFVNGLHTENDVVRKITYRDLKGNQYTQVLWHLMQHLANHSTYHRGQVVTMLRQVGIKPVATDLVAYYRQLTASQS